MPNESDILIVGTGAAGLVTASKLDKKYSINIICQEKIGQGASLYAQGGIAAVIDNYQSSLNSHIQDTIKVGDGLCNTKSVQFTVTQAKKCIQWLIHKGIKFTLDKKYENKFHLNIEGGHSKRRILHVADNTGQELQKTLIMSILKNINIKVYEYYNIIDVIIDNNKCIGAYVLNIKKNIIEVFISKITILALGGASSVYKYSSNPITANGDGIAIAYRARCRVANLEFNQFHPTCLFYNKFQSLLLSEALRGEGAYLLLKNNKRFEQKIHKNIELYPRDILSRKIYTEMKNNKLENIYLDIRHKNSNYLKTMFPSIYNKLLTINLNLTKDIIPVTPAAHYTCGGIITDYRGRTDVLGLYSVGEMTYTGLHGANRIASNSLLECLVYGFSAANDINQRVAKFKLKKNIEYKKYITNILKYSNQNKMLFSNTNEYKSQITSLMWNNVGIVRTKKTLQYAIHKIKSIKKHIYNNIQYKTNIYNALKLKNLILIAELITISAINRKESRGAHYRTDYNKKNIKFQHPTIINPNT